MFKNFFHWNSREEWKCRSFYKKNQIFLQFVQIIPCGPEKICCAIEDTQEERKSEGINANRVPFQDLPDTECPHNMKCTQETFCDQNAFISSQKLQLTKKQKSERGELIVISATLCNVLLLIIAAVF